MIISRRAASISDITAQKSSQVYYIKSYGIKPKYYSDYLKSGSPNLVLITNDFKTLKYLMRYKNILGLILFCKQSPDIYDFNFCFKKEVWILYSQDELKKSSLVLAYVIQQVGAKKISIIKTNVNPFRENCYVRQ